MQDTRTLRSWLAVGVCAAAITGVATPALAQTASNSNVIEELVVTAQKKEEALQDVPIAVSAFDQNALEKSKIDGGPNLVLAVPNVNFSKGNFTGYNFQIRGIGSKLVSGSGDAGTGIHLNNAPLIANNLFETEFYDVERERLAEKVRQATFVVAISDFARSQQHVETLRVFGIDHDILERLFLEAAFLDNKGISSRRQTRNAVKTITAGLRGLFSVGLLVSKRHRSVGHECASRICDGALNACSELCVGRNEG